MADTWIAVDHKDISRLVLDSAGRGEYAYDLAPGDVRIYDIGQVSIDDYKIRIESVARSDGENLTMRGVASADSICIDWSRKDKSCFQRESRFLQSLHDLQAAMKGNAR